jgi:putative hydrolase of the HAD superfamily
MTNPKPSALLFDLDETLIPETAPLLNAYRAVAEAIFGADVSDETVQQVRLSARRYWELHAPCPEYRERVHLGPSDGLSSDFSGDGAERARMREFIADYHRHAFDAVLPDGFVGGERLSEVWREARIGTQTVFDNAHEVLEQLGRSFRLGMVTNGAADFQRQKIAATGLGRHFEVIIVAGEIGTGKPHPEPFLAALEALGLDAGEAVMIGNDAARDIAGAEAVGIRTLWVQPGEDPEPGAITDLTQIASLL